MMPTPAHLRSHRPANRLKKGPAAMPQEPRRSAAATDFLVGHKAIAAYLDVSPETTKQWIRRPEMRLPIHKIGKMVMSTPAELQAWVAARDCRGAVRADPDRRQQARSARAATSPTASTASLDPTAEFDRRHADELRRISSLATANGIRCGRPRHRRCLTLLANRRNGLQFAFAQIPDSEIIDLLRSIRDSE